MWKQSCAQEIKDLRKEFHQLSSSATRQDKKNEVLFGLAKLNPRDGLLML